MRNRKKLPPEKTPPPLTVSPSSVQWRLDEMERQAKLLAEQVAGAFSGTNPPGLRALWLEEHLHALSQLEAQYKTLLYVQHG